MIALPALLVLLAAPSPGPLAGCEAIGDGAGGWQYECGAKLSVKIEDRAEPPLPSYLDGLERAASAILGGDVEKTTERTRLGKEEVELHRVRARDGRGTATIAALPRKGGTRILACVAAGPTAPCDRVLEALAPVPWRGDAVAGTVVQATPVLSLAGHPVQLPEGCEGKAMAHGAGQVACPPALFAHWAPLPNEATGNRTMSEFAAAVTARLSAPPFTSQRDDVPCRLGGAETTCARLRVESQGQRVVVLWATARVAEALLFGSCMAVDAASLQPPCSVLFAER